MGVFLNSTLVSPFHMQGTFILRTHRSLPSCITIVSSLFKMTYALHISHFSVFNFYTVNPMICSLGTIGNIEMFYWIFCIFSGWGYHVMLYGSPSCDKTHRSSSFVLHTFEFWLCLIWSWRNDVFLLMCIH